jgi:cation diffusion facilitator family transporter
MNLSHMEHVRVKVHDRAAELQRGLMLEALTVGWNILEGVVAVAAGSIAGSIALLSFGIDSFVETASGVVVGWRLYAERRGRSERDAERIELLTSRIAGALLMVLALYVFWESLLKLFGSTTHPLESRLGIAITALSLVVMPVLGRAKLNCAEALGSAALRADAYETIACAWLSVSTLSGLVANAVLDWWWADPIAALILIPLIVREALEGLRSHDDHDADSN